jgi:release factor glutamine methyltransferase
VQFIQSDWFAAVPAGATFDLIVANPPYLSDEEVAAAPVEVRDFEPVMALAARESGLADLRAIVAAASPFLAGGGVLALETGPMQHAALEAAARNAGFRRVESRRDLAGRDRFVLASK